MPYLTQVMFIKKTLSKEVSGNFNFSGDINVLSKEITPQILNVVKKTPLDNPKKVHSNIIELSLKCLALVAAVGEEYKYLYFFPEL